MGFDMRKMMQQAKKMQAQIARIQEELATRTVEATAGGGAVKAVVSGQRELVSLTIDREVIDPEDREMLEDLVVAAVNEGLTKAKDMADQELARITGAQGLPGGL